MTKKNKELIRERKVLQEELVLAKSLGPADGQMVAAELAAGAASAKSEKQLKEI